jgi:radical SAM superfamily enzyme YgiQ (UPF0313 family)
VHVRSALEVCRTVKARNPGILTVVGGHHATVQPADFLDPAVDLVVQGDGVRPFGDIVDRRAAGTGFDGIPGVLRPVDGRLVGEPAAPVGDLDSLPFPDRSATSAYRDRYFSEWMKPLASIRTSKGCPFRCRHCALWKTAGGAYLRRSPERVVEELQGIREECVFFADDESLVDARRMADLAERIRLAGIRKRYFFYARSDTIVKHPDLLKAWRDVGLERVFVGLEFFRDEDMAYVGKASKVNQNEEALRILGALGIAAYANFMVRPEFGRDDFRAYRRYCRKLPVDFIGFTVLTPLPGTDLFDERRGEIATRDWERFDLLHAVLPTRLPEKDFYREFAALIQGAVPLRRALGFLRRFPLREVPGLVRRSSRVLRKLRRGWRTTEGEGPAFRP